MDLNDLPLALTYDDVLLVPQRSGIRSRSQVSIASDLTRDITMETPVIAANMDTVCGWEMAATMADLGGVGIIHRFLPIDVMAAEVRKASEASNGGTIGAAIGTDHDMIDRTRACADAGARVVVLDIAHGHAEHAIEGIKRIKDECPEVQIIAGNVATAEGAVDLAEVGADAIKVGVGPGGVCTTRLVAGVGVPQLTAVSEAANSGCGVPIIADGGIRASGDIAKALAVGANSVMIGSMFAGTKEAPGEVEQTERGLFKRVRGMASREAAEARAERAGEALDDEYFEHRAAEGVEGLVPYRGSVRLLVNELMAGLKSAMSYQNAATLAEFRTNARMVRITGAGLNENHPHATV
ncbi:MAG: IMP dehydrogenase [Actinomycetota bacterium]